MYNRTREAQRAQEIKTRFKSIEIMESRTSIIIITPISNIKDNAVVDNDLVTKETHDSDMDVFHIENKSGRERMANLMRISLYDDLILRDDGKYKILHMLNK